MRVIVLSGGSGQRLWPLSRQSYPKQFLDLGFGKSLLQKTLERFPSQEVSIVTTAEYYYLVQQQAPHVDIILEPQKKNTGPAIIFAINSLLERGMIEDNETLLICPSDHFIEPLDPFFAALHVAEEAAKQGHLITFGIKPAAPETGYGYIHVEESQSVVKKVKKFVEKPSKERAEAFLKGGLHYWNSGIFLFQVTPFLKEVSILAPELLQNFAQCPTISIDYALFEKSRKIAMIPLELNWSDVGSWDSLYALLDKDENDNALIGNSIALHCDHCLVMGNKRLITASDVRDLLIVETPDALFVGKRGASQTVKDMVSLLQEKDLKEAVEHVTIHRPWGSYTVLEESPGFKIKKIVVNPGAKLSLQKHHHRSEHWVVVIGKAEVVINHETRILNQNESLFVPREALHRLKNFTQEPLEIIEVQVGSYLEEDDIERFDDVYGREVVTS